MIGLRNLERQFLGHVLGREVFPREACEQGIVGSDVGLAIYANAYRSRLREALESDHPILSVYLGDSLWEKFCTGYIEAHPSRVRSLRRFGEHASEWLAAKAPFSEHPLISELAAFERLLLDAFDAADAPRTGWTCMQQRKPDTWPGLRLRFHPSVRLLQTRHNTVEVWRALKEKQDPPKATLSTASAHLLWRDQENITRFRPVDSNEWVSLQASLVETGDFATVCERLAQRNPVGQVPELAIGCLRRWFDEGIIEHVIDA